jgi:aspartate aminotransferase
VLVTNGGKHAVYNCFEALLNPATRSSCPRRTGRPIRSRLRLAGGVTVPIITTAEGGFRATVEQLEAARTPEHQGARVRVAVQPDGRDLPRDEIEAIGRWAVEHDIWVICDEIYEHLVYGDNEFHSMATLVPRSATR